MIFIRFLQFIILIVPVVVFVYLTNQFVVPSGQFTAERIAGTSSSFIDAIVPSDRVSDVHRENGKDVVSIIEEPAFFFVHPHRDFDEVEFEVVFRNNEVGVIELGGLSQTKPDMYTLKPLHNKIIDDLKWSEITNGNLRLLQREVQFETIDDFVENLPDRNQIATYHASIEEPLHLPNYVRSNTATTYDLSFRGHHELKTYIKDETLSFEFSYMDMNREEGADDISILIFNAQNKPVAEARAYDDENISDDGLPAHGLKQVDIEVPGLAEGAYKIVINASRDVFFRKITTPQTKFVFLDQVFLSDEVGYRENPTPVRLYSNVSRLTAQTKHSQALQTIEYGPSTFDVAVPYKSHQIATRDDRVRELSVPKGDMQLTGRGFFSITKEAFFQPDPIRITQDTNVDQGGIDYILTTYRTPKKNDGWLTASVSFSNEELFLDEQAWKMSFDIPGIEETEGVQIHSVTANMKREKASMLDFLTIFSNAYAQDDE